MKYCTICTLYPVPPSISCSLYISLFVFIQLRTSSFQHLLAVCRSPLRRVEYSELNNLFCLQRNGMIECKFTQMLFECSFICNTAGRFNVFVLINTIVYTFKHSIFSVSTDLGQRETNKNVFEVDIRLRDEINTSFSRIHLLSGYKTFNTISYTTQFPHNFVSISNKPKTKAHMSAWKILNCTFSQND